MHEKRSQGDEGSSTCWGHLARRQSAIEERQRIWDGAKRTKEDALHSKVRYKWSSANPNPNGSALDRSCSLWGRADLEHLWDFKIGSKQLPGVPIKVAVKTWNMLERKLAPRMKECFMETFWTGARQVQSAFQRRKAAGIYFVIISYSFMVRHEMVQAPHADGSLDLQPDTSEGNLLFQDDSTFPVSHFFPPFKGRC